MQEKRPGKHKTAHASHNDAHQEKSPENRPERMLGKMPKSRPRILFINQYFYPLQNPPAKRLYAFSEHFSGKGWDTHVLTGQPNYPDGKLLKGYNPFFKSERLGSSANQVKVHRVPEIPLKNEGFVKRIVNYMSFSVSVFFSFPLIARSDVVFISSPPLFSSIPAYFWARVFRKKIVFDVRDLWPESAVSVVKMNKNLVYNMFFSIAKKMYRNSDQVICVTNEMKKTICCYMRDDRKVLKRDIVVINNFAPRREIVKNTGKDKIDKIFGKTTGNGKNDMKNSRIRIVYTGIMTKAQGLESILGSNRDKSIREKFEWHLVGDGDDLASLKEQFRDSDNIHFYGYKDKAFCDEMVKSADICLVPLADMPLFRMALPSKIMEYTSYGKPVIANWSKEMGSLIKEYDAGYYAESTKRFRDLLSTIRKQDIAKKAKGAVKLFNAVFERDIVCRRLFETVDPLWQEKSRK